MKNYLKRFINESAYKQNLINLNNNYFKHENDLEVLKKKIVWRCNNLGMLELDFLLGRWIKKNINNFSKEDCNKFESEVLTIETPNLYSYLLGADPKSELFKDNHFIIKIFNDIHK